MEFPLGLLFQPHEYDLIRFLFDFVTGGEVIDEALIHHEDVFGDKEPWELFSCYSSKKEKVAYFFTRLKKKGAAGSRVKRTVGKSGGNWHGQDRGKPVVDEKGTVLMGHKRSFVYKNKNEPEQEGQWLLKEFYLPEIIIKKAIAMHRSIEERKDFVLCMIQRKKKERDDDDDGEDQETTSEQGISVNDPTETVDLNGEIISYYSIPRTNCQFMGYDDVQNQERTTVPVETILAAESFSYDQETTTFVQPSVEITEEEMTILPPPPLAAYNDNNNIINSYFDGPVDILAQDNNNIADSNEFMEYAPHNQETTSSLQGTSSIGIPEESNNGCDYLWNMVVKMEDVTDLIDFD